MFCRTKAATLIGQGRRTASTGLAGILEKKPGDVVITYAKRTAVGRAKKGQLADAPVDEILQALFQVGC